MLQGRAARVLFFDSGMGGLSVFTKTAKLNANASYYYLFDHEGFPYGNKSEEYLQHRVKNLLDRACSIIKPDVIVVACNTASTTVLPIIREAIDTPIVGVVPAIKPAAKISKNKSIVLLATPGTCSRAYTNFLINEFAYDCKVMRIGSEDLVRLAEDALLSACQQRMTYEEFCHKACDMVKLKEILEPIWSCHGPKAPDAVVLGCTHFPLLKEQISTILGPKIHLIDSGEAVARRVKTILEAGYQQTMHADLKTDEESVLEHEDLLAAEEIIHVPGLSDAEVFTSGAKVAIYTGTCSQDERNKMESTFSYFHFRELLSFDELSKEH